MVRSRLLGIRRRVAVAATLTIVAMQWTIAVHACTIDISAWSASTINRAAIVSSESAAMSDCDQAGTKPAPANGRICVAHCQADAQVDSGTMTPVPPLGPQLALSVSVAAPVLIRFATTSPLFARGAAPPPLILFSRLLI
jgi:hypothetical protein